MTALDPRLTSSGLGISVITLVHIFAEHFRDNRSVCPGCGHRFNDRDLTGDCPTNTVVRPILLRRYHENLAATKVLQPDVFDNLRHTKPKPMRAKTSARPPRTPDLFDVSPYRRHHRKDGQ